MGLGTVFARLMLSHTFSAVRLHQGTGVARFMSSLALPLFAARSPLRDARGGCLRQLQARNRQDSGFLSRPVRRRAVDDGESYRRAARSAQPGAHGSEWKRCNACRYDRRQPAMLTVIRSSRNYPGLSQNKFGGSNSPTWRPRRDCLPVPSICKTICPAFKSVAAG